MGFATDFDAYLKTQLSEIAIARSRVNVTGAVNPPLVNRDETIRPFLADCSAAFGDSTREALNGLAVAAAWWGLGREV